MAPNDDAELPRWADDRMAALTPKAEWEPNEPRGLERLRRGGDRRSVRWVLWLAAAGTAGMLVLAQAPAVKAIAHKCGEFIARISGSRGGRPSPPDFTFTGSDGSSTRLSAFRGKVVVLTFPTESCAQCRDEMAWFSEFQNAYGDRDFAVVVGDRNAARQTVGSSMPTTLILDRDGRIAVRHIGYCSKAEYRRDIQKVLAEQPAGGER
jgi:peroxiredoxin